MEFNNDADKPFQTRNENGELLYFKTLKEAMDYATPNPNVWKVSFGLPTGERVRLVKVEREEAIQDGHDMGKVAHLFDWHFEPIIT